VTDKSAKSDRGVIQIYYQNFYSKMMGHESKGFLSLLWRYPHQVMEKSFKSNAGKRILELGFGEGEHFSFVATDFADYLATDIDAKRLELFRPKLIANTRLMQCDAMSLPYPDQSFDRVIATCLIAHLNDPEFALTEWRRVLKKGGELTMYVPCEPGISLRLFRRLFSAPKAKRLGFEGFNLYIARDHVNDAFRVLNLAAEVFREDTFKRIFRPLGIRSWYLNLFCVVHVTKSHSEKA
jgi:phosphatidylethanolamine/phosphatidyl-N-methylethanolamine N-methyltransferase